MAQKFEQEQAYSQQGGMVDDGGGIAGLRQVNEMLRGTIEGSSDMIAVEDAATHYLAFNRAYHAEFLKIFGVDLALGANMIEALAHLPEEQHSALELFGRMLRGDEFTITREFGDARRERRYYEIHCFPLRDSEGRILGGTHIARDVTEQRRTEEALRASAQNYQRIIESSRDCIKVLDLDGRLLSINPGGRRLLELDDLGHYLGQFWLDTWPGEERQLAAEALERARAGEIGHFFAHSSTARGHPKWWDVTVSPILNAAGQPERLLVIARDITEQKKAEGELRASEEEFRTFFESSSGGKAQADPATRRFLRVNDKLCELTGYSQTALLDMTIADIIHPEDRERQMELYLQVRDSGAAEYSTEKRYLRQDGTIIWVQATTGFLRDEAGKAYRALAVVQDITPLKRTEQELRASEERFVAFMSHLPIAAWMKDLQGRYVFVNPEAEHIFSKTLAQLQDKTDEEIFPPDTARQFQQNDHRALIDGGVIKTTEVLRQDDGLDHLSIVNKFPITGMDGRPAYIGGAAFDITERERLLAAQKLALEQLEIERQKLQTMIENMPAGVILTDAATEQRVLINSPAAEILGTALEAGSHIGVMDHQLLKSDGQPYRYDDYPIIRSLRTGEVVHGEDMLVVRPDGERRFILTNSVPIRDSEGRIVAGVVIFNDITERKQAEEVLRQSEERLKLAQQAGHVGVFDWDIVADHAVITSELEAIFGLRPKMEAGLYRNWGKYVHPKDLSRITIQFEQCLRKQCRQCNFEYRIIRPDGQVRWVEVKGQLSYLDTGQPARMVGTIVDFTERKEAEDALRESEAKFRALAEYARASFGIVQGQRFVYANPWFAQISGYSVDELLTMDFPQLVHPDFLPMMLERARRRQLGEVAPSHYDFAMLTKSGEKRWVEFSVVSIEYKGQPAMIGTGFDVTERYRSAERLALLSEAAAHLLKADNPETMIRELFEMVSRHLDLQGYMNFMVNEAGDALRLDSYAGVPDDAARQVERLEFGQGVCGTVAQCRRAIYAIEIQQSDEEIVQLLKTVGIRAYACNPLMAGGRLLGTLAFATTTRDRFSDDELEFMRTICQYVAMAKERLRLESALRGHIMQLADANSALATANNRLAEADRRKDAFLAMLAHELRNPLAPIRNAVQVLRLTGMHEDQRQRQQDIIDRQIAHMARLLNDLLDVSRITRGKIALRKQPLPLVEVLAQALEAVTPMMDAKHQKLSVIMPPENLRVMADQDRLAQVIGNLLANAAKYTDEGGRIWLEGGSENGQAVIRVRDSGMGISPEMLPHIFELFAQADQSLARSQGGLGIGLTMVKSLVEMQGGTVEARSAGLGQGSEFTVRMTPIGELPSIAPPPADSSGETSTATQPAVTKEPSAEPLMHRILVVDDIVDSCESLAELLSLWGHEVRTAHNGPMALEVTRVFRPEVILLDIGLPGMSGYEVAQRLRAEHTERPPLLIALTGYAQESDRRTAREAGFDNHLAKPVDLILLHQMLAA